MSLINKMLQDLDARGTHGADPMHLHVKPVAAPAPRAPSMRLAALCGGGFLVVAGLGWFAWAQLHAAHPAHPAQPAGAVPVPVVRKAPPAQPGSAMSATFTTRALSAAGASAAAAPAAAGPATPAAATVQLHDAAPAPAPAPVPAAPPVRAAAEPARVVLEPVAEDAPAPRVRARAPAPARVRETAADVAAAAPPAPRAKAEPKSVAPMEPDSPEAREARHAATIELATRQARMARLAAANKLGAGRKGIAPAEGRQESSAQRAENEYRRALGSLQDGRMTEAIASLQGALRIDPGHDAARQTLVSLLVEANRPDDAMRELQAGLAQDPRQPALAMLLARLQIERGGNAIETLLRSLPYAGGAADNGAEYHAFLAGALQRQGRQRDAAEQYQQALRIDPANGVWWMGLGISLQAQKRNAEALDAFQKARASGGLSAELQAFVERRIAQLAR